MNLIKKCIMIFSVFLLFPVGFTEANTNQHGSVYDDTIPLKSISYISESADVNGEILSIQGRISAQCKSDGCWLNLKDKTGEVLVDFKPHDFRPPLGIVGKKIKLNGRVNTKGGQVKVDAISVVILD